MLAAVVLALREGLEAALIVGIVLGALSKIHRSELNKAAWAGVAGAIVLSMTAAVVLRILGTSLEGKAEMLFEGTTLIIASAILTWMIFWMSRQARQVKSNLETGVRRAVLRSGGYAIFLLAFTAVLREGVELALFLTAASLEANAQGVIVGALLGLGGAAILGWLLFASLVKLDLRRFFLATGALLILFAAGLVVHSVHEFNEAGLIPAIVEHVWDSSSIVDENSWLGQLLGTLFGYHSAPSLTMLLSYLGYFALIAVGLRRAPSIVPGVQKA